jgi:hypothetical protein
MLDAFKQLVESGVMSEETKSVVEAAFTQRIQENRDQVTAELREEFAQKYNHDKQIMVEAIDKMLSDRLAAEMAELYEDKKSLEEAKNTYLSRITEDSKKLEGFVIKQLGKELVEFQSDRKKVAENFEKLEQFVVHALAKEISEFAEDKRDLAETKVKLVREAKNKFTEIRKSFIERSARIVETAVTKKLTTEIRQLKEDIEGARNNDFGRRIYEAFAQEFSASFLNEKSETSKLLKIIQKKEQDLVEAHQKIAEKQQIAESKERELRVQRDLMERKAAMTEMLAPLDASKREVMQSLLESVQTPKLAAAFEKYLPAVMDGEKKVAAKKPVLNESTEITGNREAKPEVGLDNILDIRKLAGLK